MKTFYQIPYDYASILLPVLEVCCKFTKTSLHFLLFFAVFLGISAKVLLIFAGVPAFIELCRILPVTPPLWFISCIAKSSFRSKNQDFPACFWHFLQALLAKPVYIGYHYSRDGNLLLAKQAIREELWYALYWKIRRALQHAPTSRQRTFPCLAL